jgi:predicted PurR-regulated permease PerM
MGTTPWRSDHPRAAHHPPKETHGMTLTDFLWTLVVIFFMVVYFMIILNIFSDLFRDHGTNGWVKALWILFIFVVPFLGPLVYLIVRGSGMAERAQAQAKQMQAAQVEYAKQIVAQDAATGATSSTAEIAKAHDLLQSGAITQQEFDAIKAKALAS